MKDDSWIASWLNKGKKIWNFYALLLFHWIWEKWVFIIYRSIWRLPIIDTFDWPSLKMFSRMQLTYSEWMCRNRSKCRRWMRAEKTISERKCNFLTYNFTVECRVDHRISCRMYLHNDWMLQNSSLLLLTRILILAFCYYLFHKMLSR